METNRAAMMAQRWAKLVQTWLKSLPPEGWSGSVRDLSYVLDGINAREQLYAYIPAANGLTMALQTSAPAIAAAGWSIAWRRTKAARLIEVRPLAKKGAV